MRVNFKFTTVASGQSSAYMDFKTVILIKDESTFPMSEKITRSILMEILLARYEPRKGTPIDSTESLEKIEDKMWVFKQHKPFTD